MTKECHSNKTNPIQMTKERRSNKTNKQTKYKKQQIYVVNYNQMGHYLRVKNNIAKC